MEVIQRLQSLSAFMNYEVSNDRECAVRGKNIDDVYISRAVSGNGKTINLVKTMLTSACERNCYYCAFRAGREFQRISFKPEELAHTFMSIYRAGVADGLFLSSGIAGGGIHTQDLLIKTAEILRYRLGYKGYLHLKIMPGAEHAQIERCMLLADRVSVNLEAPNRERLMMLAPKKDYSEELIQPLEWIDRIRSNKLPIKAWKSRWPSSVTQFVIGAANETDLELLETTENLINNTHLRRVYYSKFRPVDDTPLANLPAEKPEREFRLYEASYLLRDYYFKLHELPFDTNGNLPLEHDPKYLWAKLNLTHQPIDINQAGFTELVRIPGIGPKKAKYILEQRKTSKILTLSDLHKIGIDSSRVEPFILINGKQIISQTSLW